MFSTLCDLPDILWIFRKIVEKNFETNFGFLVRFLLNKINLQVLRVTSQLFFGTLILMRVFSVIVLEQVGKTCGFSALCDLWNFFLFTSFAALVLFSCFQLCKRNGWAWKQYLWEISALCNFLSWEKMSFLPWKVHPRNCFAIVRFVLNIFLNCYAPSVAVGRKLVSSSFSIVFFWTMIKVISCSIYLKEKRCIRLVDVSQNLLFWQIGVRIVLFTTFCLFPKWKINNWSLELFTW